ncbi:hypothetical protein TBLA_0A04640 [Henningerozyma blattae CBS 6284]|uniref:Dolichyl-phosphate-mannose--protein mannosyltransferase n=1 Tax=Henningerozyma blattae (strain ATCC 34711 / CBS 6284 / DSM 70876 / NBRC 10599 / NRRL Y-10934 / UCD 77-7) TaxID=1071380 RepID=I2GVV6_HENB6|nr:hypothetical protein TBLA_0A04640 [Tetrapisispora blattae CBS 6284]CCH58258.1 hypothetical protein TBLA_0A04640 [Tetrapisispora blattae CBS 6284]
MSSKLRRTEALNKDSNGLDQDTLPEINDNDSVEEKEDLSKEKEAITPATKNCSSFKCAEAVIMPIVFTGLAFFTRMYKIGANNHVVWDEAHFGKFGSYYLRHEFYHDVHPPLGKMLVGFSGYLAGYNGSWDFPSGELYPDYLDYIKMRLFNASFSALCVPLAYFTGKAIGFSLPSVWLLTLLVLCETSYATLGRFILLDSMLLFFTFSSFFCFVMFHNQRKNPFSRKWWKWMALTGLNLGCAISVKMVGLFIITLVGIYTVVDLWNYLADKKMTWKTYWAHWLSRIVCLIFIPLVVFMICFKIHFDLLWHSGTGDATMPSLFQANLVGSEVGKGPRDVVVGSSIVSLKNQALGGSLLHSHVQTFPEGSKQQQITCYGHKDSNNNWLFKRVWDQPDYSEEEENEFVVDGATYRVVHLNTGRNLHSHQIPAAVSQTSFEVSGYGNSTIGDEKDYWVVEVVNQKGKEDKTRLHPLTTSFRLRHKQLGCYLSQTGANLPEWGFRQSEVACVPSPFKRDKRTWWNIETHENEKLPESTEGFKYPKTNFFTDFVYLNLAMMATNNALVPESDKFDRLSSAAWQWPTLNIGLRLCGWGDDNPKYFLLGSPATTWPSTAAVFGFMAFFIILTLRWQRQYKDYSDAKNVNTFLMGGIYPMFGWGLHFMPFIIMARVTYVHHYLPALYFALIVLVYFFEIGTQWVSHRKNGCLIRAAIFGAYYAAIMYIFYLFSPISFGMEGPAKEYSYLAWLPKWDMAEDKF